MAVIIDVDAEEPFRARNPIKGLEAWGPYDAKRKIVDEYRDEEGYRIIVIEFEDGEKRKVRLLGDKENGDDGFGTET